MDFMIIMGYNQPSINKSGATNDSFRTHWRVHDYLSWCELYAR
ncbi:hypothetical protein [Escherichia phage IMM-001]|nr:hypothetical protein [Escherichia phage IMM-001]